MLFARAGKCICDKYKDELLNIMTPPTTYPKINEKGDQMINLHHTNMYLFSFLVTRYYHCEASEGFRVFKNLVMFTNFYYFTRKSNSSSTSGHIILNFTTFHLAGHLLMWDDGSSIKPAKHGLANFTPHCETSQPPVFQLNLPNVPASNISPNKNNACH